jgi:predicted  nucleic acid-binding Zn-ribbon protein
MWKQLLDLAKKITFLAQDTQKNKTDIKDLQNQLEELTVVVRQMAYEMRRDRENEVHEREKLVLRLEVALLRSERRNLTGRSEPAFLLEDTNAPLSPEAESKQPI